MQNEKLSYMPSSPLDSTIRASPKSFPSNETALPVVIPAMDFTVLHFVFFLVDSLKGRRKTNRCTATAMQIVMVRLFSTL